MQETNFYNPVSEILKKLDEKRVKKIMGEEKEWETFVIELDEKEKKAIQDYQPTKEKMRIFEKRLQMISNLLPVIMKEKIN